MLRQTGEHETVPVPVTPAAGGSAAALSLPARDELEALVLELDPTEHRFYSQRVQLFFLARNGSPSLPARYEPRLLRGGDWACYELDDDALAERRRLGRERFPGGGVDERVAHLLTLIEADVRARIAHHARLRAQPVPRLSEAGQRELEARQRANFCEQTGLEPEDFLERWRAGDYEDTADNMSLLLQASSLASWRERQAEGPGE